METKNRILDERALRLSRKKDEAGNHAQGLRALVFSHRPERYALPLQNVLEVIALTEPAQIPGMPAFVAGFIQRHGKIIPVVNLKLLFGVEQRGLVDLNKVIVVQSAGIVIAIQAEQIEGVENLYDNQMLQGEHHKLIKATYVNGVVLLDAEAFQSILTENSI